MNDSPESKALEALFSDVDTVLAESKVNWENKVLAAEADDKTAPSGPPGLGYFVLQKLIKHHFIKTENVVDETADADADVVVVDEVKPKKKMTKVAATATVDVVDAVTPKKKKTKVADTADVVVDEVTVIQAKVEESVDEVKPKKKIIRKKIVKKSV